ncbi:MAG TPA: response regulator [Terriglobales bacterium]
MAQAPAAEFRRRVLLVHGEQKFLDECSAELRKRGYEVLLAREGFEALCVLRGAVPEVLISELDLSRMSGFELLSVVRTRFPQVAVIATSGEYTAHSLPIETTADAFVANGPNMIFELMEAVNTAISDSPVRGSKPKSQSASVWIPRSSTGYIILTCPECLRSFSVVQPKAEMDKTLQEACISCGARVRFSISTGAMVHPPGRTDSNLTSRDRIKQSEATISASKEALAASRAMIAKKKRK